MTRNFPQPTIVLHGVCHDCRKRHEYRCSPDRFLHAMSEWEVKHRGHRIEFRSPSRRVLNGHRPSVFHAMMNWFDRLYERWSVAPWWLFDPNADLKLAYAASAAYTIGLGGLASSATFTAGREGTAVSNTTNLYLDYSAGGKVTVGTTPTTAKTIRVYAYGSVDDTPTYPDVLDGTDSAETLTNAEILATMPLLADMPVVSTTSDIAYWVFPKSIASCFGGIVPKNHGLFVAHDTVAALNATAGNHVFSSTGCYRTG
jgi:hypothetical protein